MVIQHTAEFEEWFGSLTAQEQHHVQVSINALEAMGFGLPFPHSSQIKDAPKGFPLRELRASNSLRVFYAFDPARNAVLLTGGDKSRDKKFYERMTKRAHELWKEWIAALK